MMNVFMDLETQSACNLNQRGGRRYACDESTRIMTAVFLIGDTYRVWIPGQDVTLPCFADLWPAGFERRPVRVYGDDSPPWIIDAAIAAGCTFIAHNAMGFDKHVWEALVPQQPAAWFDTIDYARSAGLPGGLDALGERFFGRGKDKGSAILKKCMVLERAEDGTYHNKHTTPGNIAAIARYNVADVIILRRIYDETCEAGDAELIALHHEINGRGVGFDAELARTLLALGNTLAEGAKDEVQRLTAGALKREDAKSPAKVKAWLASRGIPVTTLRRQVVDRMIAEPEAFMRELLQGEDDG